MQLKKNGEGQYLHICDIGCQDGKKGAETAEEDVPPDAGVSHAQVLHVQILLSIFRLGIHYGSRNPGSVT